MVSHGGGSAFAGEPAATYLQLWFSGDTVFDVFVLMVDIKLQKEVCICTIKLFCQLPPGAVQQGPGPGPPLHNYHKMKICFK